MNKKTERLVAAIENGTVIDHIPAQKTYQVAQLLGLLDTPNLTTIGNNYASEKVGKKGIIKVSDKFFTDEEISRLSVVEKKTVDTPDELCGIVKCNNPVCITNNEPMKTIFHVVDKDRGICKCHYCDMEQDMSKVKLC